MAIECPEHPDCREDLIGRINRTSKELSCRIGNRISSKAFWSGISACIAIIGLGLGVAYNAYAGRAERIEQAQKEQQQVVQRMDRTLSAVEANQKNMEKKFDQLIDLLKASIKADRGKNYGPGR